MATDPEAPTRNVREHIARSDETLEDVSKARAEVRRAELHTPFLSRALMFQAFVAAAALPVAGAAIAKLFFP